MLLLFFEGLSFPQCLIKSGIGPLKSLIRKTKSLPRAPPLSPPHPQPGARFPPAPARVVSPHNLVHMFAAEEPVFLDISRGSFRIASPNSNS